MEKVRVAVFMVLIILLVACQPSVDVQLTATSTLLPTKTSIPPTATVAPFPQLAENGPYLLVYKNISHEINIYDIQKFGRKNIDKLKLSSSIRYNPYLLYQMVSPNGKWFAYHAFDGRTETLYLLNLFTGEEVKVIEVVPEDSELRLAELEKKLPNVYPNMFSLNEEISVTSGFREGIHTVAWSPDSRYLAFAGQIDGLSSDVYIYEFDTNNTRRLNNDMLNLKWITWSPNGKYILFINDIPGVTYSGRTLHILESTQTSVKEPEIYKSGAWWLSVGWRTPTTLYISHHGDGGSWFDLGYFDIETKTIESLREEAYEDFAYDAKVNEFAFSTENGLYFVDSIGNARLVSEAVFWSIALWGGSKYKYIANDYENHTFGIAYDGSLTELSNKSSYWSISPDGQYLIVFDSQGFRLLNKKDETIQTFFVGVSNISWNPDSSGFFLSSSRELYYLLVSDNKLMLVDTCESNTCEFDLYNSIWLP